jgi:hypothetical protein
MLAGYSLRSSRDFTVSAMVAVAIAASARERDFCTVRIAERITEEGALHHSMCLHKLPRTRYKTSIRRASRSNTFLPRQRSITQQKFINREITLRIRL